ncbi:MAG: 50S ribosomal protein L6, partial [Gemmatimonadetes bacterium]|nr:50S ribosomal protein L6 [Gemmatimonadota bacterium]
MSRIGKLPVPVPNGVSVQQQGNRITVKGPRGELSRALPQVITVSQEDGRL